MAGYEGSGVAGEVGILMGGKESYDPTSLNHFHVNFGHSMPFGAKAFFVVW